MKKALTVSEEAQPPECHSRRPSNERRVRPGSRRADKVVFPTLKAQKNGLRELKAEYPVLQVTVYDAAEQAACL
jgi:hypothetical protein